MAKYAVTYEETFARTLIVEADSCDEAADKMMDAIDRGNVVLTLDDCVYDSGHISDASLATTGDLTWYDFL